MRRINQIWERFKKIDNNVDKKFSIYKGGKNRTKKWLK